MASKLSNLAENVDGVQRAAVVVSSIAMTNNMTSRTPTSTTANKNINRVVNPEGVGNVNPNTVGNANPTRTAVKGNYSGLIVMVGLNLDSKTENNPTMARNIKQTVANKLKNSDQRISQVLVTTDPTLIQRINDVAAGIIQGKPINNFESDIKDMITKIKQQQPAF
jgi:nicotinamide mononucleotide adenylyltransferase